MIILVSTDKGECVITNGCVNFAVDSYAILLLIPKKRGSGFLRTPIWHSKNALSDFITELGCDCCGLEGYVTIETGFTMNIDYIAIVSAVSKFLGVNFVNVGINELLDYVQGHNR